MHVWKTRTPLFIDSILILLCSFVHRLFMPLEILSMLALDMTMEAEHWSGFHKFGEVVHFLYQEKSFPLGN